MKEKEKTY